MVAVLREIIPLETPNAAPTEEIGCYACSLEKGRTGEDELSEMIRGHWSAIENGTHYRRDLTLGEDKCRVRDRAGAEVLATLRNLANGAYELAREYGRTQADTLASWCRRQTFGTALAALRR